MNARAARWRSRGVPVVGLGLASLGLYGWMGLGGGLPGVAAAVGVASLGLSRQVLGFLPTYLFDQYEEFNQGVRFLARSLMGGGGEPFNAIYLVVVCLGLAGFIWLVTRRGDAWAGKRYAAVFDRTAVVELSLGFYSLTALGLFVLHWKLFVWPFMAIYTAGFFYIALFGIKQRRQQQAAAYRIPSQAPASLQIAVEEPSVATDPISLRAEEIL